MDKVFTYSLLKDKQEILEFLDNEIQTLDDLISLSSQSNKKYNKL